jgi:hypothetical protein
MGLVLISIPAALVDFGLIPERPPPSVHLNQSILLFARKVFDVLHLDVVGVKAKLRD